MSKCPNGCKDTKYNILLKFEGWQKNDVGFQSDTILRLSEVLSISEQKAKSMVEFAVQRGHFLIDSQVQSEITNLSLKLAKKSIPHEVKLSKK